LGLTALGKLGGIDRIRTWAEGSFEQAISEVRDGELQLTVDGTINSFTIMPYMVILEGPAPDLLPNFEMSYQPTNGLAPSRYHYIASPFQPLTFSFENRQEDNPRPYEISHLGLFSDFGQGVYFLDYRQTFNNPASTIQYGFSVLSIDYTPRHVTEPGSVTLLMFGSAFYAWLTRRSRCA
jgi:hypothetical protein